VLGFQRLYEGAGGSGEPLKLLFRLGTLGLTLPIQDVSGLAEIPPEGLLPLDEAIDFRLGYLRDPAGLPVYDLAAGLQMTGGICSPAIILVLGDESPWGAMVDEVEGVLRMDELEPLPLPLLWQQDGRLGVSGLPCRNGEPILTCQVEDLARWVGRTPERGEL